MTTVAPAISATRRIAFPAAAVGATLVLVSSSGAPLRAVAVVAVAVCASLAATKWLARGPAAFLAALVGVAALGGGLIARDVVTIVGGAVMTAAALHRAWGVNRHRSRRNAWALRGLTAFAAIAALLLLLYPTLITIDYLAKPRRAIDAAALGLAHRDVSFEASDGVALSGWYVPSRNGAAVVVVHGGGGDRTGAVRHARMLAAHGFGVLLYDARGRGESRGHANAFGWRWDRDVRGAVDLLASYGVRRIGLLGLSTGAEAVVTEAAHDARVRAVVADGLQGRSLADVEAMPAADKLQLVPLFGAVEAELRIATGESPPPPIHELLATLASDRPVLLVATVPFERTADRRHVRGTKATLWELPDTAHTGGLGKHRAAYERRVLRTFAALG